MRKRHVKFSTKYRGCHDWVNEEVLMSSVSKHDKKKKKRNLRLEWNAEINIKNKIKDNQLPNVGEQGFHSIKRISKNN